MLHLDFYKNNSSIFSLVFARKKCKGANLNTFFDQLLGLNQKLKIDITWFWLISFFHYYINKQYYECFHSVDILFIVIYLFFIQNTLFLDFFYLLQSSYIIPSCHIVFHTIINVEYAHMQANNIKSLEGFGIKNSKSET